MKFIVLLAALTACAFFFSGCQLFDGSVQKAQEVASARQDIVNRAVADMTSAGNELDSLVKQYNDAKARGDTTAVQAIEQVMPAAVARYKTAQDAVKSASDAFDVAVQDFKDAKSTSDYLGTTLGWLTSIFTGLLGGGTALKFGLDAKASNKALAITSSNIDTAVDDKAAGSFKAAQTNAFKSEPAALKALKAARGK